MANIGVQNSDKIVQLSKEEIERENERLFARGERIAKGIAFAVAWTPYAAIGFALFTMR